MHKINTFEPIHVTDMTTAEKKIAQMGLMLIGQKDGKPVK